jgi:hypothetical protein
MGSDFAWIGTIASDWSDPSNWADITTGQTPAVTAPGTLDTVTIGNGSITGTGSAAVVTILQEPIWGLAAFDVSFLGSVYAGTIASGGSGPESGLSQPGNLDIAAGATLSANTVDLPYDPIDGQLFAQFISMTNDGLIVGNTIAIGSDFLPVPRFPRDNQPPVSEWSLDGTGTVEVQQGGSLSLIANVETAGFTFQLDGGAIMTTAATLVAGTTIDMIGKGNALQITGGSAQNATVDGFNNTDTLELTNLGLNSATITPTGALLVLSNLSTLTLNGSFAGDRFEVIPTVFATNFNSDRSGITEVYTSSFVLLDSSVNETPSTGTGSADTYTWTGGTAGDWGSAANWTDVTQGQTPAIVAPGSLDTIFINSAGLSGNGNAASLTWAGQDSEFGNINSGQVIVAALLYVAAGATQTASVLQIGSDTGNGYLAAINGGSVLTNSLTLTPNGGNVVSTDTLSVIHVGTGTSAAAGALTIDPGATVAGQGTLLGNVIDNGVIQSTNMTIGTSLSYSPPTPPDIVVLTDFPYSLSGTGTIEVQTGGTVVLGAPVTTAGLTFQLDGNANLQLEVSVAASNTIELTGTANVLTLDKNVADFFPGSGGELPVVAATIAGFNATDTLVIQSSSVSVTAFQDGTLTVQDAAGTTASFDFAGLDPDDTWTTTAISGSEVALTIACFAAGTRIATPSGDIPIERLCQGDTVETVSGLRSGSAEKRPVPVPGSRGLRRTGPDSDQIPDQRQHDCPNAG